MYTQDAALAVADSARRDAFYMHTQTLWSTYKARVEEFLDELDSWEVPPRPFLPQDEIEYSCMLAAAGGEREGVGGLGGGDGGEREEEDEIFSSSSASSTSPIAKSSVYGTSTSGATEEEEDDASSTTAESSRTEDATIKITAAAATTTTTAFTFKDEKSEAEWITKLLLAPLLITSASCIMRASLDACSDALIENSPSTRLALTIGSSNIVYCFGEELSVGLQPKSLPPVAPAIPKLRRSQSERPAAKGSTHTHLALPTPAASPLAGALKQQHALASSVPSSPVPRNGLRRKTSDPGFR